MRGLEINLWVEEEEKIKTNLLSLSFVYLVFPVGISQPPNDTLLLSLHLSPSCSYSLPLGAALSDDDDDDSRVMPQIL